MARLPVPGSDDGTWGTILNEYLLQAHNADGSLKPQSVSGGTIKNQSISEEKLDSALAQKINTQTSGGSSTVNWTAEAQAKAQGYWIVYGSTAPTETTMYGVPVIWARDSGMSQPIPVAASPPSFP